MNYSKLQKLLKSRDKRRCSQCGKMLKYKNFRTIQYDLDKYKFQSPCMNCENYNQRTDPKRYKYKFNKYNISEKEYLSMLQKQDNKCAICSKSFNNDFKANKPTIDHSHEFNKIRGILCNNCNAILGFASDDIEILNRAIQYLEKSIRGIQTV